MGELTIRYDDSDGGLVARWAEGYKEVSWRLDNDQDLIPVLKDIIAAVEPMNPGPLFLAPSQHQVLPNTPDPGVNEGAERADRAAREAELALMNGGKAISMELPFAGVPTYEPDAIPPVDWSQ